MKLHIFNPEHDIALACDKNSITLPHAIQEFKMNLGFLPAVWADDDDCVLVDDVPFAVKALGLFRKPHADVLFLDKSNLKYLSFSSIEPWGWDRNIRSTLLNLGVDANVLPNDDTLLNIRRLSSRTQTSNMLNCIRSGIESLTCGESVFASNVSDASELIAKYGTAVLKAPWSSSGRGVKYVTTKELPHPIAGWLRNVINSQDGVMVEPYYNRIKDFAMEFFSYGDGRIDYCGLSLFSTDHGSYKGNIIAPEAEKASAINYYIPSGLLPMVKDRVKDYLSKLLKGAYKGPLGVDMIIATDNKGERFLLHPCVEINLRRTMGHVANSFKLTDNTPNELMRIVHEVNYEVKFEAMENNFVKVI